MQSIYTRLIYNTTGQTDVQFRWTRLTSVIYLLSFVLGLRWGILGVASCYAVAWTLLMALSFRIPFGLVKLSGMEFVRTLWPTVSYSIGMAVVAGGWRLALWRAGVHNAIFELVSTVALGGATYVALLYWRRPPVLGEFAAILGGSNHPLIRAVSRLPREPDAVVFARADHREPHHEQ